ncbi:hypothetical protein FRC15_009748 [Serendipita sp. 397]|nr:hypothetical protein FRC15_009748 [Serendipita sp. 397]
MVTNSPDDDRSLIGPPLALPQPTFTVAKTAIHRHLGLLAPSRPPPAQKRVEQSRSTHLSHSISPAQLPQQHPLPEKPTTLSAGIGHRQSPRTATPDTAEQSPLVDKIQSLAKELTGIRRPDQIKRNESNVVTPTLTPPTTTTTTTTNASSSVSPAAKPSPTPPPVQNSKPTTTTTTNGKGKEKQAVVVISSSSSTPVPKPSDSSVTSPPIPLPLPLPSSSTQSNPTVPLPSVVDRMVHENTHARFGDGLKVEMITTPFEPRRITVVRIPVPLPGGSKEPSSSSSSSSSSPLIKDLRSPMAKKEEEVKRAEEIMRAVFEQVGTVVRCEFSRVGVGDSSNMKGSSMLAVPSSSSSFSSAPPRFTSGPSRLSSSQNSSCSTNSSLSSSNSPPTLELIAHVEYAHHQQAANAIRAINENAPTGFSIPVFTTQSPSSTASVTLQRTKQQQQKSSNEKNSQPQQQQQQQPFTLPSTLSASFSKTIAPNQPSTTMVSDTVLIRWDIPRPRIRVYYKEGRVARRELEIINRRMFFGRKLLARFFGASKNVILVEGVSIPAGAIAAAAAVGKANSGAGGGEREDGSGEKEKVKAMREEGEWEEERLGEEVKEFRRRHSPDGEIRVFDDGYVHEDVMQLIRGFVQVEEERTRALEEMEKTMVGLGEETSMYLKVGLKSFEIKENLNPSGTTTTNKPSSSTSPSSFTTSSSSSTPVVSVISSSSKLEPPVVACPQGNVAIRVNFHNSGAASAFYTSLKALVAPFRWRRAGRLTTTLSKDLLYVMTAEKFNLLSPQIEQLRTQLEPVQLRMQVSIPNGHSGYRHVKIVGSGPKRVFKPMIDALLIGEVIVRDPPDAASASATSTSESRNSSTGISTGKVGVDAGGGGERKMALSKATAASKPLWDAELDFLYGIQHLVDNVRMPPETQILIDRPRRNLLVFGPSSVRRNLARERLLQKFDEVKKRLKVVTFNRYLLRYYAQAVERELIPKFGQTNVWLDHAACRLTVAGQQAVQCLLDVEKKAPQPNQLLQLFLSGGGSETDKATGQCPVCLEQPDNPVKGLGCGHSYCQSCLTQYLLCATQPGGTLPIRCFGAIAPVVVDDQKENVITADSTTSLGKTAPRANSKRERERGRQQPNQRGGNSNKREPAPAQEVNEVKLQGETNTGAATPMQCNTLIPLAVIRRVLSAEQFDTALKTSFDSYILARPAEYHHCPTSDCPEIYRVFGSDEKDGSKPSTSASPSNAHVEAALLMSSNAQHCPSCLMKICPVCFAEGGHDGFTCEQHRKYQQDLLAEEAAQVETWVKNFGGRKCPKCNMGLLKDGGCAHVRCSRCGVHICWTCGKAFGEVEKESVYEHMNRVHGGIGLIDWGDDANGGVILEEMRQFRQNNNNDTETDEAIARALEETEDEGPQAVSSHSLTRTGSGSSGGSGTLQGNEARGGGRNPASNGDSRQRRDVGQGSQQRKGKKKARRRTGVPQHRSYPRYENKDELSEDENDDFGGGGWDYDFTDMNWEAL